VTHAPFGAASQQSLRKLASNTPMALMAPGANPTGAHVLVVDDEPAITDLLSTALRYMGYQVTTAGTGQAALEAVATASPDLVVLDVMLPDLDGFEVCRRLRDMREFVPVIFLSARDTEDDRVTGFVRGGDDYVTKPFSLEELTLRIGALLRRVRGTSGDDGRLRYRDLEMDEDRHQVWRGGREVSLSPTEFRLLRYFLLNPERVLSKQQILDHVWQYDFNGEDNVVETYVSYLRRKLDEGEPRLLRTVRGFGYVLRAEVAAQATRP
jgi:two-component system OmpR family response regulator